MVLPDVQAVAAADETVPSPPPTRMTSTSAELPASANAFSKSRPATRSQLIVFPHCENDFAIFKINEFEIMLKLDFNFAR